MNRQYNILYDDLECKATIKFSNIYKPAYFGQVKKYGVAFVIDNFYDRVKIKQVAGFSGVSFRMREDQKMYNATSGYKPKVICNCGYNFLIEAQRVAEARNIDLDYFFRDTKAVLTLCLYEYSHFERDQENAGQAFGIQSLTLDPMQVYENATNKP